MLRESFRKLSTVVLIGSIQAKTDVRRKFIEHLSQLDTDRVVNVLEHVERYCAKPLLFASDENKLRSLFTDLSKTYWPLMAYVNSIIIAPLLSKPERLKTLFLEDLPVIFLDFVDRLLELEHVLGESTTSSILSALELVLEYDLGVVERLESLLDVTQALQLGEQASIVDLGLTTLVISVLGDYISPGLVVQNVRSLASLTGDQAEKLISSSVRIIGTQGRLVKIPPLHAKLVRERLRRMEFWFDEQDLFEPVDWDFVASLSARVRIALEKYMQGTVSIGKAAFMAGLTFRKFDEIRAAAKIPMRTPQLEC